MEIHREFQSNIALVMPGNGHRSLLSLGNYANQPFRAEASFRSSDFRD